MGGSLLAGGSWRLMNFHTPFVLCRVRCKLVGVFHSSCCLVDRVCTCMLLHIGRRWVFFCQQHRPLRCNTPPRCFAEPPTRPKRVANYIDARCFQVDDFISRLLNKLPRKLLFFVPAGFGHLLRMAGFVFSRRVFSTVSRASSLLLSSLP